MMTDEQMQTRLAIIATLLGGGGPVPPEHNDLLYWAVGFDDDDLKDRRILFTKLNDEVPRRYVADLDMIRAWLEAQQEAEERKMRAAIEKARAR